MIKQLFFSFAALCATACQSATEPVKLNVMTFNMRYDNPEDGAYNWRYRKEKAAAAIASHDIDLLGAQELLHNQLTDLQALLPDYEPVGVGRLDGKQAGEYSAVFFKKARFELVNSGWFWLSETPEVAGSKGWDGACERIVTWAVLKERGGQELLMVNTHLDHVGQVARREGVALLMQRIEQLREGRPVILTGDFNADPDSPVIAHVQATGVLHDAKGVAERTDGPDWSFTDFGNLAEEQRTLIDYIFVSSDIRVAHYEVLGDKATEGWISDHAPVTAEVIVEPTK